MRVFRELLLLSLSCLVIITQGRESTESSNIDNVGFKVPSQFMEAYMRDGVLRKIPWASFHSFENKWTSMLNPIVSNTTSNKINNFFNEMTRANDNQHRAMDSIVAMCSSSEISLKRVLENKSLKIANKVLLRIMNNFAESKKHLDDFKLNLVAATKYINSIDTQEEISNVRKSTESDDKTGKPETKGSSYGRKEPEPFDNHPPHQWNQHAQGNYPNGYYSPNEPAPGNYPNRHYQPNQAVPENNPVYNYQPNQPAPRNNPVYNYQPNQPAPGNNPVYNYQPRNPVNNNNAHRRAARDLLDFSFFSKASTPKPVDKNAPQVIAFFTRMNSIRIELKKTLKDVNDLITYMETRLNNQRPVEELPTLEELDAILDKCENYNYNPVF